jgi:hypothetical protein
MESWRRRERKAPVIMSLPEPVDKVRGQGGVRRTKRVCRPEITVCYRCGRHHSPREREQALTLST